MRNSTYIFRLHNCILFAQLGTLVSFPLLDKEFNFLVCSFGNQRSGRGLLEVFIAPLPFSLQQVQGFQQVQVLCFKFSVQASIYLTTTVLS